MNYKIRRICIGCIILLTIIWFPILSGRNGSFIDITNEIIFPNENRIETDKYAYTGSGRTLRSGHYKMRYETEGTGKVKVILSSNNCSSLVPDTFLLDAEKVTEEIEFTAYTDVDYLKVEITGEQETNAVIRSVSISSHSALDRRITVSLILVVFSGVSILFVGGQIDRNQLAIIFLLTFVVLTASVPCMKDDLTVGDDMYYHWERLTGLIASLRSGQFPARMYPTMNNGYGGVAPIYYPDLFLYPLAILVIFGATMQYAFHFYLVMTNVVTVFGMYIFAKYITNKKETAAIAATIYTLSTYRLTDLYTRSALGEGLAMAILPVFLMLFLEVIFGDKGRWPLLSIAAALLLRAHMITTLFVLILCIGMCIVLFKDIVRRNRIPSLFFAAACAFLLCIPIFLPLWTMTKSGVTARMMMRTLALKAIEPAQLFFSTVGELHGSWKTEHLMYRAIEIGVPLLAGVAIYIYEDINRMEDKESNRMIKLFLIIGTLSVFMTTTWFPWSKIEVLTKYISKYIQFPWRLILITVCLFTIPAAEAYSRLGERSVLIVLAICLGFALPLERLQTLNENVIPYGRTVEWMQLFGDYNFEGTISSRAVDRNIQLTGDAEIREYHRSGTNMTVDIATKEETTVLLPLYAFEGYRVQFNGEPVDTYRGEENRLALTIPENMDGELKVVYVGNPIWRVGEIVGIITLLCMIVLILRRKKPMLNINLIGKDSTVHQDI